MARVLVHQQRLQSMLPCDDRPSLRHGHVEEKTQCFGVFNGDETTDVLIGT
jgi:hypothetical protein